MHGTSSTRELLTRAANLLEGTPVSPNATAGVALLLELAQDRLPKMQSQALANTLWAVSKLDVDEPAFVGALLSEAKPKLANYNALDLTNTAYALAKLGREDKAFKGLVSVLLDAASTKLPSFNDKSSPTSYGPSQRWGTGASSLSACCWRRPNPTCTASTCRTLKTFPTRRGHWPHWATRTKRSWRSAGDGCAQAAQL
jgi:hypothetical protein